MCMKRISLQISPYSRKDDVKERYQYLRKNFPQISFLERLDLSLDYAFAQRDFDDKRLGTFGRTQQYREEKRKEIREYFRKNTNQFNIYKKLFKSDFASKELSKYSLMGIKKKGHLNMFRIEDLAPILYIFFRLRGTQEFKHDYIVVDEAQDLSLIQIYTLYQTAKNNNITLAGDLAQSIIPPFYIKDWNMILDIFKEDGIKNFSYHQLNRCYRTTVEIINFANKIFKKRFPKSYKLPEAVLRHGEEVQIEEYSDYISQLGKEPLDNLLSMIKRDFQKGSVTCAILCRDRKHAQSIYSTLKPYENILERNIVSYEENDYKSGLLILPIANAKGLEFDSIIIADLNSEYYPETELNIRLLYVAFTRALHRVYVVIKKDNASTILLP